MSEILSLPDFYHANVVISFTTGKTWGRLEDFDSIGILLITPNDHKKFIPYTAIQEIVVNE